MNKETQTYDKYTLGAKVEMMIFRNQQIINNKMDTHITMNVLISCHLLLFLQIEQSANILQDYI